MSLLQKLSFALVTAGYAASVGGQTLPAGTPGDFSALQSKKYADIDRIRLDAISDHVDKKYSAGAAKFLEASEKFRALETEYPGKAYELHAVTEIALMQAAEMDVLAGKFKEAVALYQRAVPELRMYAMRSMAASVAPFPRESAFSTYIRAAAGQIFAETLDKQPDHALILLPNLQREIHFFTTARTTSERDLKDQQVAAMSMTAEVASAAAYAMIVKGDTTAVHTVLVEPIAAYRKDPKVVPGDRLSFFAEALIYDGAATKNEDSLREGGRIAEGQWIEMPDAPKYRIWLFMQHMGRKMPDPFH